MKEFDFYAINARKPLNHTFSEVYRTVLPSSAAECHMQMLTSIFLILSD